MTPEEYKNTSENLINLVTCALNGTVPDPERVRAMNLEQVYQLASFHFLNAAAAMALEAAGVRSHAFTQGKDKAIRKVALMEVEMKALFGKLNQAGIWYMPLKGAVLKDLYPAYGMRQMSDVDMLADASRAEEIRTIMEAQGFSTEYFNTSHNDVYHKEPVCNFEIHRTLFDPYEDEENRLYTYYQNVKYRLLGDGCEKRFSPEDFYLYMVAHEFKHYSVSGTGLRSLADTYVYLTQTDMDRNYVRCELQKLGLADFEAAIRSQSLHLFRGEELSQAEREMLDYILLSGVYGTNRHRVDNTMKKNGWGRLRYMIHRFSIPLSRKDTRYESMSRMYPFFYQHRLLLPLLPIYRTLRALKDGRLMPEVRAVFRAGKEKQRDTDKAI